VSIALGAFVAGVVMRESEYSHRAAEETLPLRDAFSVLFFVSIGMAVNPHILIDHPFKVMLVVLIAIVGNVVAALVVVLALKYPLNTALSIAVSLGQIGEFSIILAGLGLGLGLLNSDGVSLILAAVVISISLNSFLFAATEPLRRWVLGKSAVARRLEMRQDPFAELPMSTDRKFLEGQVVLVGYGRVGRRIAQAMDARNIPYVVVEQNREVVEDLRRAGRRCFWTRRLRPAPLRW
jgi:CPA2 family monovalent cation:H+ antiporter-2